MVNFSQKSVDTAPILSTIEYYGPGATDLSSPITHSPRSFTPLEEQLIRQLDEMNIPSEGSHATYSELQGGSSMASVGNGSFRTDGHAILKGSPKALGWEVDEETEAQAWERLMGDALEGSVYDHSDDDEDAEAESLLQQKQSKKELYKTYLKHWDDEKVTLVWRIVPSMKGVHKWVLEPKVNSQTPVLPTTCEMGTGTDDLVEEHHAEMSVQTEIKSYASVDVQTDVVEVPQQISENQLVSSPVASDPPANTFTLDSRPPSPTVAKNAPTALSRQLSRSSVASSAQVETPQSLPTRATSPAPSNVLPGAYDFSKNESPTTPVIAEANSSDAALASSNAAAPGVAQVTADSLFRAVRRLSALNAWRG